MAGLEGTVKLPAFGTVKKKTAAEAGGGAVLLVLLIWYVRQRKAAQAAATAGTAAGTVTDPAGNTCSAINPATGYCPNTLEDQQALSDSVSAQDAGALYDASGGASGTLGAGYASGGAITSPAPGPGSFASNAAWAQYAEAYLTGSAGGDPATVGNAIGKYLTGQPVTTDQVAVIDEAIAYAGQPPQSGPGGDPPGINTTPGSTGSASSSAGSTSSSSTSSSGTGGGSSPARTAAGAVSNLQASNRTPTGFTGHWNPVKGATGGYRYVLEQLNHVQVAEGTTGATSASFTGLHPGWTYNLGVQALPGGPGDNIHVTLPSK